MNKLDRYYQILEINSGASVEEIKKAYRQLAKKWHPDNFVNDSPEKTELAETKFLEIHEAYEILKNQENFVHFNDQNQEANKNQQSVFIRKNLDNHTKKAEFYYNLGVEEAENEQWEEAISYFTHAIRLDNNFIDAYYYRGAVLDKQGLELRAESDWSRAEYLKSLGNNRVEFNYSQNSNIRKKRTNYISKKKFNNSVRKNQNSLFMWFTIAFTFLLVAFGLALVNQDERIRNNNQGFDGYFNEKKDRV